MSGHKPIQGMQGTHGSLWTHTVGETQYPPLSGEAECDVAVIGGGITGLTTAYLLQQAGYKTAVLEMGRIARGTTGHSTAKLTAAHGLVYDYLIGQFGRDRARIYAEANQWAVGWMRDLVAREGLDCDFREMKACTYAETGDELRAVEAEARAAESLGLPASFTDAPGLPFDVKGGVCFRDQARFHPAKYLLGLQGLLLGGVAIHERTRALDVEDGDPCTVTTDRGTVKAKHVVVATMYPFLKAGEFFAKLTPHQSYVMAARVDGQLPDGMFFSAGSYGTTIRPQPYEDGDVLIFGGDAHKVGQGGDIVQRYRALEGRLRESFPVRSLEYYWTTHDAVSMDLVPYIGRVSPAVKNVYVATGFKQWGLTHGTIAAHILADLIAGKENEWLELYDATRLKPATAAKEFVEQNAQVAKEFVKGVLASPPEDPGRLEPDSASVVERDGETTGLYKTDAGGVEAVSLTCTHLGCKLHWDNAERTWDCPCHGSRFDHDGAVAYGPANRDLEKKKESE